MNRSRFSERDRKHGRKQRARTSIDSSSFDASQARLLSQVEESLHLALASVDDPRLYLSTVVSVRAQPGHGPLLVTIAAPQGAVEETHLALQSAKGRLRSEVAFALQRKRAPDFSFLVLAASDGSSDEEDAWWRDASEDEGQLG